MDGMVMLFLSFFFNSLYFLLRIEKQLGLEDKENWITAEELQQSLGFNKRIHPPKFNIEFTPEKWWLLKTILSYWVPVTFQGRAVKISGG